MNTYWRHLKCRGLWGILGVFLLSLSGMPAAQAKLISHDGVSLSADGSPNGSLQQDVTISQTKPASLHDLIVSDDDDDDGNIGRGLSDQDAKATMGLIVLMIVGGFLGIPIYFLPTIIAVIRKHEYKGVITIVNIFCGWTGLVWLGLLAWSVWPRQEPLNGGNYGGNRPPPFPSGRGTDSSMSVCSDASLEPFEKLEKLVRMKQDGLLSEAEFEAAKARILRSI
ncbi:superinfection immunity protein [Saccharibacter sp. 17.LH.SD]|uniref:superinfection immunity protein n=1 Tax=Saccharibacter sp. 17.LH.SD TaxID=2689393 RepID=UPI00137182BB|nr:superinfection immunity protein [Saccharibacter sp. 17.LH.SD]MXV43567.1 superinfection immunity protein [Saccharibacter sp. 17.LH.SD]